MITKINIIKDFEESEQRERDEEILQVHLRIPTTLEFLNVNIKMLI